MTMGARLSDLEHELDCAYMGQARAMRHVASLTADRDTMAATLRGLLLRNARHEIREGRFWAQSDRHLRHRRFTVATRQHYADAALALVLALLIGGDHA